MNVVNSCAAYFQYLFKKAIKVFAVTFDQFNVSLLNKSIYFFSYRPYIFEHYCYTIV